jgi:hypothetical protein
MVQVSWQTYLLSHPCTGYNICIHLSLPPPPMAVTVALGSGSAFVSADGSCNSFVAPVAYTLDVLPLFSQRVMVLCAPNKTLTMLDPIVLSVIGDVICSGSIELDQSLSTKPETLIILIVICWCCEDGPGWSRSGRRSGRRLCVDGVAFEEWERDEWGVLYVWTACGVYES